MNTLDRYVLKQVIPVFLIALGGLSCILAIADLFTYIHLIVDRQIPFGEIIFLLIWYLPQGVLYALPVSLLFAICLTMASLFTNNELVAILNSGVSFMRLSRTIILFGFMVSIGSLIFQDLVQVPTIAERNRRIDSLIGRPAPQDDRNITVWDRSGTTLYYADRYSETGQKLSNLSILVFKNTKLTQRIDAAQAHFNRDENIWKLQEARVFFLNEASTVSFHQEFSDPRFNEPPEYFRGREDSVDHMRIGEAVEYIRRMQFVDAQIHREAMTDLYERIVFSFTPLLVAFLSVSVGSRLKKNILLLSMFFSLGISVLYYIYEFIFLILARQGYLHPLTGSLLPFLTFFILSIVLYRNAKT